MMAQQQVPFWRCQGVQVGTRARLPPTLDQHTAAPGQAWRASLELYGLLCHPSREAEQSGPRELPLSAEELSVGSHALVITLVSYSKATLYPRDTAVLQAEQLSLLMR